MSTYIYYKSDTYQQDDFKLVGAGLIERTFN